MGQLSQSIMVDEIVLYYVIVASSIMVLGIAATLHVTYVDPSEALHEEYEDFNEACAVAMLLGLTIWIAAVFVFTLQRVTAV